ncbi:MAG: tetratricopeptide repeat protein [Flavobacteriales bacterium]|nr:tetratricopeptide repeat protein [Flavobacteriales bacterium]|tara:strand:- start:763 stop:1461 length:699 start_codon:yes stop_codon:yes gene_type:complete
MAKKVNKTEEQLANVEENLSKAGLFVVDNQEKIVKIMGSIVVIIAIFTLYTKFIVEPKEKEASEEMYIAEFYFQNNDFDKALNGDGQYSGFLTVANNYSSTKSGNLAYYYAAICQMNLAPNDSINYYENALNSLTNFDTDDEILYSLSTGLKGDANLELGNTNEALKYYELASNDYQNDFTTPYFLMKQAFVHELNEDFNLALNIYESIKENYPQSKEGLSIDKYISSASNR